MRHSCSYNRFSLPRYWGNGKHVSADGTKWNMYEKNLLSEYYIRHGERDARCHGFVDAGAQRVSGGGDGDAMRHAHLRAGFEPHTLRVEVTTGQRTTAGAVTHPKPDAA